MGPLAKGDSITYDCTSPALTADLHNVASVTGHPPVGPDVTANDAADVTVIHPAIGIEKSPDGQSVTSGDTVTFTIKVTNTGDVDLTNVTVTDPLTPSCDKATLAASFANVASVTGHPPVGPDVTASDSAPVTVANTGDVTLMNVNVTDA